MNPSALWQWSITSVAALSIACSEHDAMLGASYSPGGLPSLPPSELNECVPTIAEVPSEASNSPNIQVLGESVVIHPLGQPYRDSGAHAESSGAGALTDLVEVDGLERLDVDTIGDYWVRYSVTTAEGSAEALRLVRVSDGRQFARQSARPLASTSSPLGYFEHLPVAYGADAEQRFPLLVYNHGVGEAYDWWPQDEDEYGKSPNRLDRLLRRGVSALLAAGEWDDTLPLVVLSPQRCLLDTESEVAYLRAFLDYALRTYRIDSDRIYMVGFSAGSYITWEYTLRHSQQLAATAHIGGGDTELTQCPRDQPPTWSFHARDDETVPLNEDLRTIRFINSCRPRERAKLTVLPRGGHLIDQAVLDGSAIGSATSEFDPFDQSLYAWLMGYTR